MTSTSETSSDGQEMEDVYYDAYGDGAGRFELGSMVDKLVEESQIDREEAIKRQGALLQRPIETATYSWETGCEETTSRMVATLFCPSVGDGDGRNHD